MAGLLDFSQARLFALTPPTANSAFEGAQLVQPRHPVFGVPGAEDLPVLELMDVDGLDTQAAALCTNAHELRPLCAADGGSHHHLVAVLDDVFDDDPQIREGRSQLGEGALGASGSRGNAGRRRDVDPFGRQDLVEQCRVFLVEGFVPEYDVAPVVLSGLGVRRRTDQGGQ